MAGSEEEWGLSRDEPTGVLEIHGHSDGSVVTWGGFLSLLGAADERGRRFREWYTGRLLAADVSSRGGFFWECSPVARAMLDSQRFSFVLKAAPMLEIAAADPEPFSKHLQRARDGQHAIGFSNLSRDAMLVIPTQQQQAANYTHLFSFLRTASHAQIDGFWKQVAATSLEFLAARPSPVADPMWLSTSGLGVSWLHVRCSSVPKYYSYKPFTKYQSPA